MFDNILFEFLLKACYLNFAALLNFCTRHLGFRQLDSLLENINRSKYVSVHHGTVFLFKTCEKYASPENDLNKESIQIILNKESI